jgi:hypothetical protein
MNVLEYLMLLNQRLSYLMLSGLLFHLLKQPKPQKLLRMLDLSRCTNQNLTVVPTASEASVSLSYQFVRHGLLLHMTLIYQSLPSSVRHQRLLSYLLQGLL